MMVREDVHGRKYSTAETENDFHYRTCFLKYVRITLPIGRIRNYIFFICITR